MVSVHKKDILNIKLQRCWAHARRKFTYILKSIPKDQIKDTTSFKIVELICQLFKFEALYKETDVPVSDILNRRFIDQTPIINALKLYIIDTFLSLISLIESAIKYVRSIWSDLLEYFNHLYLEISNNIAEHAIKPFVINRKVFMKAGSYVGARYTTTIFSVIRTALINHLDIQKYLMYLLDNLGEIDLIDLLPYSDKLPKEILSKL
ncbi:Transposase and inactivated derivatives [Acholeplasma oculi]|uniref:Transposase, IS66 n=1 Tax=Acholeplasma oculi TaxID=35623 RepID=A0A061A8T4_9MOLU|nr:transposase [Acholeplasma oculi]CDR30248.1 Transposase, IS66 [Acholeplasma oculi]SUT88652.1 Transposase and inactivated derivatives [Acholeplasma oculi]